MISFFLNIKIITKQRVYYNLQGIRHLPVATTSYFLRGPQFSSVTKQSPKCRGRCIFCGFFLSYKRFRPMEPTCPQRHAGSWASPATSCAAPVTCWESSAWARSSLSVDSAASRRPRWSPGSSTLGPSWKCVDESWGGSLKSKYVRGADPILKLLDDNGNIAEELSILKWNTDSVEEFLSEKLEVYNTDS
uniref:Selenoprotein F n=1 Tax=Oncorhynchus mykiss TaxID=8022 RepID=A0A8C7UJ53_ONCMY